MKRQIVDFFLGPCIRKIPSAASAPTIYLTFDDGPDPNCTPQVLDVLERHGALATFFVVATKVKAHPEILREALARGHAYGNHSLDHSFRPFFAKDRELREWIAKGQDVLEKITGVTPVGFRSPAGVRTPPLRRQLKALGLNLIHWEQRFFDTARPWTEDNALAALEKHSPGAIVLLHDRQEPARRELFLKTLDCYLQAATERGFRFAPITPSDVARAKKVQTEII